MKIETLIRPMAKRLRASSTSFVALALVLLLLTPFFPAPAVPRSHPNRSELQPLATGLTGFQQATGKSTIYNPYWYVDKRTKATLEITNNAHSDRTLTPVLMLGGTERVSLDPVTIPSLTTARLSLNTALAARLPGVRASGLRQRWGDGTRKRSLWGSALLEGESTGGISSWIISESPKESLSINTLFSGDADATPILSSMWWLPTANSKVAYALQNVSATELKLVTFLYLNQKVVTGRMVTLPAGGTRLVDLRDLLPDATPVVEPTEVGMVRFVDPSASGRLLGRTLIFDEEVGFAVPLMAHGIGSNRSNVLQMPGTPFGRPDRSMGFPKSTRFTTQLLLTNTSENAIDVVASLDGKDAAGIPVSWDAPLIRLAPFESRVTNLEKIRLEGHAPVVDGHVGVRLSHTGNTPDLLVETVTVDQTLTFSFYDPFFDSKQAGFVLRAVSFNLSGNKNTLLVVKNPSGEQNRFSYTLSYQDAGVVSSYKSRDIDLAPYELKVVDLKAVRDKGVEDVGGKRLPAGVSFGNASIYSGQTVLAGGDPTFDAVAGTCYSCLDDCGGDAVGDCSNQAACQSCLAAETAAANDAWNADIFQAEVAAAAAAATAALAAVGPCGSGCAYLLAPPLVAECTAVCVAAAAAAAAAATFLALKGVADAKYNDRLLNAPRTCGCR